MMAKLKCCPFCGDTNCSTDISRCGSCKCGYYVKCYTCGARTESWWDEETAIKFWNDRAEVTT